MPDDWTTVPVDVRIRDLDPLGHVNNAVYVTYLEHASIAFFEREFREPLPDVDMVIAHLDIDYERPILREDDVRVAIQLTDVGRTSLELTYEIRASGRIAATARQVRVCLDDAGEPRPIPEHWRSALESCRAREGTVGEENVQG